MIFGVYKLLAHHFAESIPTEMNNEDVDVCTTNRAPWASEGKAAQRARAGTIAPQPAFGNLHFYEIPTSPVAIAAAAPRSLSTSSIGSPVANIRLQTEDTSFIFATCATVPKYKNKLNILYIKFIF